MPIELLLLAAEGINAFDQEKVSRTVAAGLQGLERRINHEKTAVNLFMATQARMAGYQV